MNLIGCSLVDRLQSYQFWNFRVNSESFNSINIDFARFLGYIPQSNYNLTRFDSPEPDTEIGIATQIYILKCDSFSTTYRVNITNQDGAQSIEYRTEGNRPLDYPESAVFTFTDSKNKLDPNNLDDSYLRSIIPRQSAEYREWASRKVTKYLRAVNTYLLWVYATGSITGYHGMRLELNVIQGVSCIKDGWTETHGTATRQVDLCLLVTSVYDGIGYYSVEEGNVT